MLTCDVTVGSDAPCRLATVSEDGVLAVWDTTNGTVVQQHARPTHLAVRWTCIAWHTAGLIALGTDSGLVVVWDLALGRVVHELHGHTQHVNDVTFDVDGHSLLSCAQDRTIMCWGIPGGELRHTQPAGQAAVQRLLCTSTSEYVIVASNAIRLLRRDTWKRAGKVPGHAGRITCLCMSPDNRLVASSANDRHVSIWRMAPGSMSDDDADACVQTLALDTPVVQLSFERYGLRSP